MPDSRLIFPTLPNFIEPTLNKPVYIKKLSIVIPAYNEGPTIYRILYKIKTVQLINEIQNENIKYRFVR